MHIGIDAFRLVGPPTSIGTYTHELIQALAAQGFTFTLYAPRREPGAELDRYLAPDSPVRVVFAKKPSAPERKPWDLFLWNQCTLPQLMKQHHCDAFIAPYQQVPCFTPHGIPALVVIHDLCGLRRDCGYRFPGMAWARHFWNLLTAACRASRIVPISVSTRDDMLRTFPFCRKRLAAPIYNKVSGTTLDEASARKHVEPLAVPDSPFILAFGITGPRKALSISLEGYAIYRKQGGNLPLVLIGVEYEQAVDRHIPEAWRKDILLLPRISTCERDALYRLATCLLFCSRCEGFGYPIVEAMRQGCPVIASATTPAAEITDGIIELMTHPDAAQCARLIGRYAVMDPAARKQLGAALMARSNVYDGDSFGADFAREIARLKA
jgi:glycosyltransferase involved in cell wall biosynthesis